MKHLFLSLLISVQCFSQPVKDVAFVAPANKVHGYLGNKINLCIENRIKAQALDEMTDPFRHRTETRYWQSEFWGKWITSAIDAYKYSGDAALKTKIDDAVKQLIATQSPNGYIGNYADSSHLQFWDIWGRKYCLLGLIAYYDLTKNNTALSAAKKLLDYTMTEVGPGKKNISETGWFMGMPSGSILEPVVLLYNRTGDKRYLDFATYIVRSWESHSGPRLIEKALCGIPVAERFPLGPSDDWWSRENGQKAYEMMSCYEGLIELYRVTGKQEYLNAVNAAVKNITDEEINICGSGASYECWYHGKNKQTAQAKHTMETCVTMTWMKLIFNLYRLTGDPSYIDQLETSIYNALLASMTPNGGTFAKYTPLTGICETAPAQPGMKFMHCCLANGPRAMMIIPSAGIMKNENGLIINFYHPSTIKTNVGKSDVEIAVLNDYPVSDDVEIILKSTKETSFPLSLRIPVWSTETSIEINGEKIKAKNGEYLVFNRKWNKVNKIIIHFDMRGQIIPAPNDPKQFFALARGPIVLARSKQLDSDVDEDELLQSPVKNKYIDLQPVKNKPENIWMAFQGSFLTGSFHEDVKAHTQTIPFCDFASAGNSWDHKSRFRVWIPIVLDPSLH